MGTSGFFPPVSQSSVLGGSNGAPFVLARKRARPATLRPQRPAARASSMEPHAGGPRSPLRSNADVKQIAANLRATVIIQHEPRDVAGLPAFPQRAR